MDRLQNLSLNALYQKTNNFWSNHYTSFQLAFLMYTVPLCITGSLGAEVPNCFLSQIATGFKKGGLKPVHLNIKSKGTSVHFYLEFREQRSNLVCTYKQSFGENAVMQVFCPHNYVCMCN